MTEQKHLMTADDRLDGTRSAAVSKSADQSGGEAVRMRRDARPEMHVVSIEIEGDQ